MCEPIDVLELIDETPPRWDGPHVGRRLMEAMRTLRMLPMPGVTGYRPAWPAYAYEFEDLLAQHEQGELERTQQQAVNCVALAHALERDAGWVAAKRGGYADTWRQRHDTGCEIIATRLRVELVPVF